MIDNQVSAPVSDVIQSNQDEPIATLANDNSSLGWNDVISHRTQTLTAPVSDRETYNITSSQFQKWQDKLQKIDHMKLDNEKKTNRHHLMKALEDIERQLNILFPNPNPNL